MKYWMLVAGLIGILSLFNTQEEVVVGSEETNHITLLSDQSFPPLAGIQHSENHFTLSARDHFLNFQKRICPGLGVILPPRFFRVPFVFNPKEYNPDRSVNLFLIYQHSLSLWAVIRQ